MCTMGPSFTTSASHADIFFPCPVVEYHPAKSHV